MTVFLVKWLLLGRLSFVGNNYNNSLNGNNNINNNGRVVGIVQTLNWLGFSFFEVSIMTNLYDEIVSLDNLEKSFENASRGKSGKKYVIDFEKELKENLAKLHYELFL